MARLPPRWNASAVLISSRSSRLFALALVAGIGLGIGSCRGRPRTQPVVLTLVSSSNTFELPETAVCNGVLLSDHTVVTASHCVSSEARGIDYLVGGSSLCAEDGWVLGRSEDVTVLDAVDLAVSGQAQIDTTPTAAMSESSTVVVEGWGFRLGDATCELSRIELKVLDTPACSAAARRAGLDVLEPSRWACAIGPPLCAGFSGSGVYQDDELVGLVSFGSGCGDSDGVTFFSRMSLADRDL